LGVSNIVAADTGAYRCKLTTECGGVTLTNPATLSICLADFNCSGTGSGDGVTEQDIFDFLNAFFTRDTRADTNKDGVLTSGDIFEFLNRYFSGC
ncbi:MAG: GC-type dockerin domain-anchored protein, partial [Phycisphaerales bacterium]